MDSGLWLLKGGDKGFTPSLILKESGGFEHATHVADLDGDGTLEIYAASEKPDYRLLRRFVWDGAAWKSEVIAPIPDKHITWNLQDAKL